MPAAIRRATESEFTACVELTRACVAAMQAEGIDQWDSVYPTADTLAADLREQSLWCAVFDRRVGGLVVINTHQDPEYADVPWAVPDLPVAVVHRLMVHPEFQGRGVAVDLMRFAERSSFEAGFRALRLDAFTQNPRALRLYERLGYSRAGSVRFRKGEFVCFEKRLTSPS